MRLYSNHNSNSLTMCLICIKIRHFPIPTHIQIHAWNIAKAATITQQMGKKFGAKGPIQDNFISSWQHRMLVIGQPDKMLTDLRNSKWSRELSAVWMKNIISGVNQKCFESFVFTLYVLMPGQGTRYSNDTASLLPKLRLLAEATVPSGLSYHCLMQPSGNQHLHKSSSLSLLAL